VAFILIFAHLKEVMVLLLGVEMEIGPQEARDHDHCGYCQNGLCDASGVYFYSVGLRQNAEQCDAILAQVLLTMLLESPEG
jgi:hypothetical protein